MDLKFKSPKWVGSIYHRFEAICHEVDDFVSQDTVKYVENQAQAVGGSVKKFYSNVVQDLLPSSLTQPGRQEPQVLSLEQKEKVRTYISSSEMEDLEHDYLDIVLGGKDLKGRITDQKYDTCFEKNYPNEGPIGKTPYNFEESELKEELMDTIGNSVEANDPNIEPSLLKEKEDLMKTNAKKVEENDEPSPPKEKEELMNTNTNNVEENDLKGDPSQPIEMGLFYPEKASLSSDTKNEVACDTNMCDTDSPLSSEMVDVPHSEENICYYLVDEIENASDPSDATSSSQPLDIVFHDDTDLKLAISSSTFDEDVPSADDIAAVVSSFEDNPCKDYAHLEALMSFLKVDEEDDFMFDIKDPSMVTIELSNDSENVGESCINVENKLLYAVFCRSRKHKSFKKILQDAFASRKRLRKEYEHLGILLGDVNLDTSPQQQGNDIFHKIPSSSLGSGNLLPCDLSEWELL